MLSKDAPLLTLVLGAPVSMRRSTTRFVMPLMRQALAIWNHSKFWNINGCSNAPVIPGTRQPLQVSPMHGAPCAGRNADEVSLLSSIAGTKDWNEQGSWQRERTIRPSASCMSFAKLSTSDPGGTHSAQARKRVVRPRLPGTPARGSIPRASICDLKLRDAAIRCFIYRPTCFPDGGTIAPESTQHARSGTTQLSAAHALITGREP